MKDGFKNRFTNILINFILCKQVIFNQINTQVSAHHLYYPVK